jgi:hypothetical protein
VAQRVELKEADNRNIVVPKNKGLTFYYQQNPQEYKQLLTEIETAKQAKQSQAEYNSYVQEYNVEATKYNDSVAKQEAYDREVQAQEHAYKAWQKGISYYWYKGKPEYKYLRDLWENYGSYSRIERERLAEIQRRKINGGNYTWTEYTNGIPISSTLYEKGREKLKVNFDEKKIKEQFSEKNPNLKVNVNWQTQEAKIINLNKQVPVMTQEEPEGKPGFQFVKPSKFTFGNERPVIQESGMLIVTEEEAKANAGKSSFSNYWTLQSKNINDAVLEGEFIANTKTYGGDFESSSIYKFNRVQIETSQETFRQFKNITSQFESNPESFVGKTGVNVIKEYDANLEPTGNKQIQLTGEYFSKNIKSQELYKNTVTKVNTDYKTSFSIYKRADLRLKGMGQGVLQLGVGVLEFQSTIFVNFAKNQYTQEELSKPFSFTKAYATGGILGDIRNLPSTPVSVGLLESPTKYAKEKIASAEFQGTALVVIPAIAYGAKNTYSFYKKEGLTATLSETASSLSPFRLSNAVYTPSINSKTKFDVTSYKFTNQQTGVTTRIYKGKEYLGVEGGKKVYGLVNIEGFEQSKVIGDKVIGGGLRITKAPYLKIQGGLSSFGTRTILQPYSFNSVAGTANLAKGSTAFYFSKPTGLKGGQSDVTVSRGYEIYSGNNEVFSIDNTRTALRVSTGGVNRNVKQGVSYFIGGKAQPIFMTERYEQGFIYRPTGRYKLSPNVFGREYDLNSLFGSSSGGGTTGGTGRLKVVSSFNNQVGTTFNVQSTIPKMSKNNIILPLTKSKTSTQTYTPNTVLTVQKNVQLPRQEEGVKLDTGQIVGNVPIVDTATRGGSRTRNRNIALPISTPIESPALIELPKVAISPIQRTRGRQATRQRTVNVNRGTSDNPFGAYPPSSPPIIRLKKIPLPKFDNLGLGMGDIKSKGARRAYTPSFTALFFKIGGSQPRRVSKTGLSFRPVTSNFNLARFTGGRVIRVRRVRL